MENGRTSGKRGGGGRRYNGDDKVIAQFGKRKEKEREKKGGEGNLLFESSPSSKRLVNLCKVSGAGTGEGGERSEVRGAGPPSLSRLLFERDSSVDKTIAGGIIGIIYAGFSRQIGEGSSWERGRSGLGEGREEGSPYHEPECTLRKGSWKKIPRQL